MLLDDLPLLDRRFTWSHNRQAPTLVRLDRALINTAWGQQLFNSTLTSLVRQTSDHVPLLLTATSTAPVSQVFRYEKHWAMREDYKELVSSVWASQVNQVPNSAQRVVKKLKWVRARSKKYAKYLKRPKEVVEACQQVIQLLDIMEEFRHLTEAEFMLRVYAKEQLSDQNKALEINWKQRYRLSCANSAMETQLFYMHVLQPT